MSKTVALAVEDQQVNFVQVPTTLGPALVVVVGDTSLPAIVTYHEAGLTPEQTFGLFVNTQRASEIVELFSWYHVYAPGTQPDVPEWNGPYPTLEQIASQLGEIIRHFQIGPAIILGVGAGGNIAVRLSSVQPDLVKGLILIGTTTKAASFREKSGVLLGKFESYMWKSAEAKTACSRLLSRFFSNETLNNAVNLVSKCRSALNNMSANMLKFELAYESRDDITPRLNNVTAHVLYFVGLSSPHTEEQLEIWEEFNQGPEMYGRRSSGVSKMSIIKVDNAGDLITAEHPTSLFHPIALFFVSLDINREDLMQIDFVYDVNAVPDRDDVLRAAFGDANDAVIDVV